MGRNRDERRFNFFMIDNRIIDEEIAYLGPVGFLIYCALVRFHFRDSGACPSYKQLIACLGVSRMSIARTIRKLVERKLIALETRPGKKTRYRLLDFDTPADAPAGAPRATRNRTSVQTITYVNQSHQGTGSGNTSEPVRFPGVTPLESLHVGYFQNHHQHQSAAADGRVEIDPSAAPQHALLTSCGVHEPAASQIAAKTSLAFLECVVAYWRGKFGGVRECGPGLLVDACLHPGRFHIVETPDGWRHPALRRPRGRAGDPPAIAAKSADERLAETLRQRAAAAQDRQAAASGANVLFKDLDPKRRGPY